jgi:hypothetical protein
MELKMSDDLDRLEIYANDHNECMGIFGEDKERLHVATIPDPVLMTDLAALNKFEPGLRDALMSLYMRPTRTVTYDGVVSRHHPDLYPGVWSANIDTLWFARQMKEHLLGVERMLECGTGSGFLSQYALHHGDSLKRIWATDINPYALKSLVDNCPDPRVQGCHVSGDTIGIHGEWDLVICNPPYIPRPRARTDNPYEGLKLIQLILEQNYPNVLMNISSTAGDLGLGEPIAEKTLPLKVNTVTNGVSPTSQAWLEWLIDNNRVIVRDPTVYGYRYWHTLRMYHIH